MEGAPTQPRSADTVWVEDERQLADICGVLIGHRVAFTVEPAQGSSFHVSLAPDGADLITQMYGPERKRA